MNMDPLSLLLQPPVHYPVVPYMCTIFGGLRPGKMVLVQGRVSGTANRFQIDLQVGCSTRPRADVAFHFNPRFSSSETSVVCNTLHMEQWLHEVHHPGPQLRKGQPFLLLFLFLEDKIKVSINGQHLLDYPNRLPLCDVDTIGIHGDISVQGISFLCRNPFSDSITEYPVCQPLKLGNVAMTTPLSKTLPNGISEGHMTTVRGLASANPDEIVILLKSADFIPFKLTASFRDQTLLYSYLMGPRWAEPQEIQTPFFLFHAERFVQIHIFSETNGFRLAINGVPLGVFCPPVLDLKSINEIQINGSIKIYSFIC
ncbi:galectin-12 isoform X1 [Xenopus laevis]|uniref:Galectin n=1 Tax=Xenopus laevis TaxID=8355 RepID=A0A8J0V0S0_XENLA|nr:galectin-12 isoform X1 [Xenopus laevis]